MQQSVESRDVQDVSRKDGEMCCGANLTMLETHGWTVGESILGFPQYVADCLIKQENAC